jgi:hypothetical protein
MVNRKWKRFWTWTVITTAWLAVFGIHAYYHVRSLTGQCCGYEGDPGFLLLFFLVWPGLLYFVVLFLIFILFLYPN